MAVACCGCVVDAWLDAAVDRRKETNKVTLPKNIICSHCGKHLGVYVGEEFVPETVVLTVFCLECDKILQGIGERQEQKT